jgi:hypothetical protein
MSSIYFQIKGIARPQSPFLHSCVCERIIYSQDLSTYLAAANRQTNPRNVYVNLSQMHKCRKWETEHFNSVLEIIRLHIFISGNTFAVLVQTAVGHYRPTMAVSAFKTEKYCFQGI